MNQDDTPAKALKLLLQLSKWGEIHPFLLENGYLPQAPNTEKHCKRVLVDLDTFVVALLLYGRYSDGGDHYTLRSLATALDDADFNATKAMEKKLKLLFERVEIYQIINVYKDIHQGKRECLRIEATPKLVQFIESKLFVE